MIKWRIIIGIGTFICLALLIKASDPSVVSEDSLIVRTEPVHDDRQLPEYQDGIYQGQSAEWTGMKVEVHIESGKIMQVDVLEANGTPEFYEVVLKKLPRLMEMQGSAEVDAVTGATLSSESLKKAVRAALQKAIKS